ncbi:MULTISPECIES: FAD-dependent monooxygenase [unclassified Arthrobacter]|uniref:FAD-dependent monooxygenase n=1 Tax=unclassified Arthrobacter TaxID=235627 RepID=UPI0006FE290B|nr:FAD-dependent monooxygenase [Arthrobacter sp. Soil764]KRE81390.1 monooxygenase [Arthrobacter sp. Soil764]
MRADGRPLTEPTDHPSSPGTALVVGASLAGLMTALTLSRAGVHVTLLERSDDTGRTGAALQVPDGLLERITGLPASQVPQPLAPGIQTWFAVHDALRAAIETNPIIELHQNTTVRKVGQDGQSAWVLTSDKQRITADLVIGADGHRSTVRRHIAPDHPDATFAGYVIWIGIADESAIGARRWPRDVAFLGDNDHTLLGYPLPGAEGSREPGSRRLGWAWYDSSRNGLLRSTGSVSGSVVRHSLMPAGIPSGTFRELAAQARELFPSPWKDAILDSIERRAVIGTPIAEYVPVRLATGRVAIVGDAAHVPTPMTGSGFAESLHDAEAIADAITDFGTTSTALHSYENARLRSARNLVQSGQGFSRSFARRAA